ncbi:MAG: hypothetical protein K6A97_09340 [Lachnospiraceae bacterium]|nr:hypothetical protein [Lachnospiraceae bacterium]
MAINGLLDYGGLYSNYRPIQIPMVDVSEVAKQDENAIKASENVVAAPVLETPVNDNRSRMADLDNISLNFNTGDDYSYIGSESDMATLDMEKLISDMKKDKVLEDYQYFVGSTNTQNTFADNDGAVFLKY